MMPRLACIASIAMFTAACGSTTDLTGSTADAATDASVTDAAHVDAARDAGDGATDGDAADGATDARSADAASFACGDQTCAAGDVCVRTYTTGGVCLLCGDGGACPTGWHCGGQCCVNDVPSYGYACKPTPSACAEGLSCSGPCGNAVCVSGGCPCESVSGSTATCHCLAP